MPTRTDIDTGADGHRDVAADDGADGDHAADRSDEHAGVGDAKLCRRPDSSADGNANIDTAAHVVADADTDRRGADLCGRCDGNGTVTIDELVRQSSFLGGADISSCPAADADSSGSVTIDEIVSAVNNLLGGCPGR
jgi:hypothetical protein